MASNADVTRLLSLCREAADAMHPFAMTLSRASAHEGQIADTLMTSTPSATVMRHNYAMITASKFDAWIPSVTCYMLSSQVAHHVQACLFET